MLHRSSYKKMQSFILKNEDDLEISETPPAKKKLSSSYYGLPCIKQFLLTKFFYTLIYDTYNNNGGIQSDQITRFILYMYKSKCILNLMYAFSANISLLIILL